MTTYNKFWEMLHIYIIGLMAWICLCGFLPGIELGHPADFEMRDLYREWQEWHRDPLWERSEQEQKEIEREKAERIEAEQVEKEE